MPALESSDECLNQEIFYSLKEAQIVIEQWRNQYNTIRPAAARSKSAVLFAIANAIELFRRHGPRWRLRYRKALQ
jgi:integrase-like protein